MSYNRTLSSKDARSLADDLIDTIEVLEDCVRELQDQIEEMKKQNTDAVFEAEQKGYDDGYNKGCVETLAECEKKWKPKFVFR
jgi:flagellar biosynthesis/type III secretory pathway protein FliH